MPTSLVTGGTGFLGSHLCARLLGQDCEVICVDNYFTGTRNNIRHLLDDPCFELMRHDCPTETSVGELARRLIALTGSRSRIEYRSLPQDDPRQRRPDISRALELLRWQPRVSLDEGLKRTIAYFEEKLSGDTNAVQPLTRRAAGQWAASIG